MSIAILALYGWAYFADVQSISEALLITDEVAVISAVALIFGVVSYFWAPRTNIFWSALASFLTLTLLISILILGTGGHASPFIALWMIVAVFAGVFGWLGLLPLFLASIGYLVSVSADNALTRDAIIAVALAGELPLLFSYVIWHTKSTLTNNDGRDRAYTDLASELSEASNKSEVVISAIADGVVAINNKGIIQLINPAAQQIIGWGRQDALSLNYKSVLKLLDKDGHELAPSLDPVSQVLASNEKIVTNDLQIATNSDKKLMASISVSPVGQVGSGVIVIFRDITNEKAEERAQAEFISTASHEMRTPVATIEGYLGLALNPATAQIDDKARDFITKAHDSAQHLGRLFSDLLDISRAEDGRLTSNPKVVDTVNFIDTITEGLRPQATAKGLVLVYKPSPEGRTEKTLGDRRLNPVFYANVDNDHLREVMTNLIENAIKYTPQGSITVDVVGDASHITISVTDSGIGIPKEDQAHLFQKFYRVDNTDTREIGGTGLGLYLSRRLAEAMGGRLWVESAYRKGSTFYLEISRVSHEDAMHAIESADSENEVTDIQTYSRVPALEVVPQVNDNPPQEQPPQPVYQDQQPVYQDPQPIPQDPIAQTMALPEQPPQPPVMQPLQPAPTATNPPIDYTQQQPQPTYQPAYEQPPQPVPTPQQPTQYERPTVIPPRQ